MEKNRNMTRRIVRRLGQNAAAGRAGLPGSAAPSGAAGELDPVVAAASPSSLQDAVASHDEEATSTSTRPDLTSHIQNRRSVRRSLGGFVVVHRRCLS
jgi:hypothetical protein